MQILDENIQSLRNKNIELRITGCGTSYSKTQMYLPEILAWEKEEL